MLEKLNKRRDDWKTNTAFTKTKVFKTGARLQCQYCSSWPPGTKYECPYCPLPLLLPQLLRPLCPSCSCNTSPPLHPIVPPCPPPSCPSPGVVLCEAWTWARRRAVSGGNQYLSRALPTKEPKIYGYSRLQWAIYKGAAILTSLQLKELGRQWQNGRRSNKDLWFSLHTPTLQTNDKSKKHQRHKRTFMLYKSSYFWQLLESWTSCYFSLQFPYNPCNHPVILMNELFCRFSFKRQLQIFGQPFPKSRLQ